MSESTVPEGLPDEAARSLAEIARELGRLSEALAECARRGDTKTLRETGEALTRLSQRLEEEPSREAADAEARRTAHLRQAVLEALRRGGPALFPELAAVTLSLPDEIRPVLQTMEKEGLVEIRTLQGWQLVALTPRGRQEAGERR